MKLFFIQYWKLIFKVLFVIGCVDGYRLFFPRVTTVFYDYLTKNGFHDAGFQEFLKVLPHFLMLFLWIIAICTLLIDVFIMPRFSLGKAVIYWGNKYFVWISTIGCFMAFMNVLSTNKFDFQLKIWFAYMLILAFSVVSLAIFQGILDARKSTAKRREFEGMRWSKNGDF